MAGYGSLVNHLEAQGAQREVPSVGDGATLYWYTDRHAYTVVDVRENLKGTPIVTIQRDAVIRVSGSSHDGSIVYRFDARTDGLKQEVALGRDGKWKVRHSGGQLVRFGDRSEYHDPSF